MVRAFRRGERWLAATLAAAAVAHWLLIGRWSEWHGGESWGPRMMTDALPLLFLFLPDGLDVAAAASAAVLAALSVAVQALGAFAYDYRWERLYQRRRGRHGTRSCGTWRAAPSSSTRSGAWLILALPAGGEGRAVGPRAPGGAVRPERVARHVRRGRRRRV